MFRSRIYGRLSIINFNNFYIIVFQKHTIIIIIHTLLFVLFRYKVYSIIICPILLCIYKIVKWAKGYV